MRWGIAVIALAGLIAVLPALPAALASVAAPASVSDSAGMGGGTVTVTRCFRGWLLVNWQCQGTFAYSDPMASDPTQLPHVFANVVLANDPHHYDRGAQVGASLRAGTNRAYLWGFSYEVSVLVLLLGFVLCAYLAAALIFRPRYVNLWVSGGILVFGMTCLSPTIAGL